MAQDGRPARPDDVIREAPARRRADGSRRGASSIGVGVVVAIAAAILLAACGKSGPSASAGASASARTGSASTAPSVEPAGQLNVNFQAAHDSKIYGGAQINDLGDGTSLVSVGLVALGFDLPMPSTIAAGTCAAAIAAPVPSPIPASPSPSAGGSASPSSGASSSPAASGAASASPAPSPSASAAASPASSAPAASASAAASPSASAAPGTLPADLNAISSGGSTTQIGFTLAKLLASPSAIVIRKSSLDLTVVACADITSSPAGSATP
jgi:hypothetical protein